MILSKKISMVASKVKTCKVLYLIYEFEFVPICNFTHQFWSRSLYLRKKNQTKKPQQQQQQQQNLVFATSWERKLSLEGAITMEAITRLYSISKGERNLRVKIKQTFSQAYHILISTITSYGNITQKISVRNILEIIHFHFIWYAVIVLNQKLIRLV